MNPTISEFPLIDLPSTYTIRSKHVTKWNVQCIQVYYRKMYTQIFVTSGLLLLKEGVVSVYAAYRLAAFILEYR